MHTVVAIQYDKTTTHYHIPAHSKYTVRPTVHNCLATVLYVDYYMCTRNYGKIVSNIEV